jgi:hypothetical protein
MQVLLVRLLACPFHIATYGFAAMYAWNSVVAKITKLPDASFWQATALAAVMHYFCNGRASGITPVHDENFSETQNAIVEAMLDVFYPLTFSFGLWIYLCLGGF